MRNVYFKIEVVCSSCVYDVHYSVKYSRATGRPSRRAYAITRTRAPVRARVEHGLTIWAILPHSQYRVLDILGRNHTNRNRRGSSRGGKTPYRGRARVRKMPPAECRTAIKRGIRAYRQPQSCLLNDTCVFTFLEQYGDRVRTIFGRSNDTAT